MLLLNLINMKALLWKPFFSLRLRAAVKVAIAHLATDASLHPPSYCLNYCESAVPSRCTALSSAEGWGTLFFLFLLGRPPFTSSHLQGWFRVLFIHKGLNGLATWLRCPLSLRPPTSDFRHRSPRCTNTAESHSALTISVNSYSTIIALRLFRFEDNCRKTTFAAHTAHLSISKIS